MKFPAFEPINLKNNIDVVSVEEIYLSKIHPNMNQSIKNFEETEFEMFASPIKKFISLSDSVRKFLINGQLEVGHVKALLTLPSDRQIEYACKIVEKNLTVHEAEQLIACVKKPKEIQSPLYESKVQGWLNKLSKSLSSKVAISINDKGEGTVEIHFTSPDEIDCIVEYFTNEVKI